MTTTVIHMSTFLHRSRCISISNVCQRRRVSGISQLFHWEPATHAGCSGARCQLQGRTCSQSRPEKWEWDGVGQLWPNKIMMWDISLSDSRVFFLTKYIIVIRIEYDVWWFLFDIPYFVGTTLMYHMLGDGHQFLSARFDVNRRVPGSWPIPFHTQIGKSLCPFGFKKSDQNMKT